MSAQAAEQMEQALERTFGGRRFTVRPAGKGYVLLEAGREVAAFTHDDATAGLWETALDELERAGVIDRCERCGDDRDRGNGWARFCGHCADAFENGTDDDWNDPQALRSA